MDDSTISEKLTSISDTKAEIKSAIEDMGISDVGNVFSTYPSKIRQISQDYYTKSEVNSLLGGKSNTDHTHGALNLVGFVTMFAGATPPDGWILCKSGYIFLTKSGEATGIHTAKQRVPNCSNTGDLAQDELLALYNVLATGNYNTGTATSSGATWTHKWSFDTQYPSSISAEDETARKAWYNGRSYIELPSFYLRFPLGAGDYSSWTCGRQTYNPTLGNTGGKESHRLDLSEIPSHTHSYAKWNESGSQMSIEGGSSMWGKMSETGATGGQTSGETTITLSHNNIPPYMAINFMIRYKN